MDKWDLARELRDLFKENLNKTNSTDLALQWSAYRLWDKYHKKSGK